MYFKLNTGVELYSEIGQTSLLNNTLINPQDHLSDSSGLSCLTALNSQSVGTWYFPNGTQIGLLSGRVLFAVRRVRRVELLISQNGHFTSDFEGVYTCRIQDEQRTMQVLYIGIYTASNYQNSGAVYGSLI